MARERWFAVALFALVSANSGLLKAIKDDNAAMINIVLKAGNLATANTPFGEADGGEAPLMTAVILGKHRAAKALLKGRADASVPHSASGLSVMHQAASLGRARIVQMLLTHGLDPRERAADGLTVLHRAVVSGDTDTVKSVLNAEVPPDERTSDGRLPAELASDDAAGLAVREVLKKFSRGDAKAEL